MSTAKEAPDLGHQTAGNGIYRSGREESREVLSVSSDPWREKTAEGGILATLTRARSRMFSTSIPNDRGSLSGKGIRIPSTGYNHCLGGTGS